MAAPLLLEIIRSVTVLILTFTTIALSEVPDYEGALTFTLEHTFESGDHATWTKRGVINVRSLKPGRTHISQPGGPSQEEIAQLNEAVKKNGVYRIRAPLRATDNADSASMKYVSSFTLACAVYESHWSDHITLNLDQSGEAIGVSIVTYPGICTGRSVMEFELSRYNSSVEIEQAVLGPSPDTQTYIEKMKKEESERAKGQQQDNRSFFAKYWMYIVPGVIIMLLMNSMDTQGGGGGGGGR